MKTLSLNNSYQSKNKPMNGNQNAKMTNALNLKPTWIGKKKENSDPLSNKEPVDHA